MLESGYIKVFRSLLDWEWYDDINTKVLFLHLLLTVNYEEKKWRGISVKRGQRIASYGKLAKEIGVSVQSVRTAIKHLISTGELTHDITAEYGLFTVSNYDKFQDLTSFVTYDQHTANTQPTDDQQQRKKANKANKAKKVTPYISPFVVYGEFQKVELTDEEHAKLVQRLGKDSTADYIERLDGWLAEGNKKKSHYATILNWWRKDNKGSEGKGSDTNNIFLQLMQEGENG